MTPLSPLPPSRIPSDMGTEQYSARQKTGDTIISEREDGKCVSARARTHTCVHICGVSQGKTSAWVPAA